MLDSCFMKKVHIELKASLRCSLTKYLFTLGLVQNGPLTLSVGQEKVKKFISWKKTTVVFRDVTTGATGATAVAPKFSDTLTLSQPRGADSAHHCRGRS